MRLSITRLLAAIPLLVLGTASHGANWSQWERENAVVQERDWLVIRQPGEGFCYVKQSYDNDLSKMEISVGQEGIPAIVTPFFRGIIGGIAYQVDDGPVYQVPASEIEQANLIHLAPDLIPEMKAGQQLFVRVHPVGEEPRTQAFSLLGFTAALKVLDREDCQ